MFERNISGVSRERCSVSQPTGRLRVREASGFPYAVRARRRCREGVGLADPQWRHDAVAPGGSGELPPGGRTFRVGVDELLEGGLVDEHGGYGPLSSCGVVGGQGVVELDAGRANAPAGAGAADPDATGPHSQIICGLLGVGTKRVEFVGRAVLVGEGVDRGEGRLCCGSVALALGLCLAADPGRRLPGGRRFRAEEGSRAPMCSPPVVRGSPWACRQQGWAGGSKESPGRGGGAGPRTAV